MSSSIVYYNINFYLIFIFSSLVPKSLVIVTHSLLTAPKEWIIYQSFSLLWGVLLEINPALNSMKVKEINLFNTGAYIHSLTLQSTTVLGFGYYDIIYWYCPIAILQFF